jgi:hypothetical protein
MPEQRHGPNILTRRLPKASHKHYFSTPLSGTTVCAEIHYFCFPSHFCGVAACCSAELHETKLSCFIAALLYVQETEEVYEIRVLRETFI